MALVGFVIATWGVRATPARAIPRDAAQAGSEAAADDTKQETGERLSMALLALLGAGFLLVPLALHAGSRDGAWGARRTRAEQREDDDADRRTHHGADIAGALAALGGKDTAFSEPLFLQFVKKLVQRIVDEDTSSLGSLSPYLVPLLTPKPSVRARDAALGRRARCLAFRRHLPDLTSDERTQRLREIVVDDVQIVGVTSARPGGKASVQVTVEVSLIANVAPAGGSELTEPHDTLRVLRETWVLTRSPDAPSRSPEEVGQFGCPSCDRPWDETAQAQTSGRCPSCDARVRSPARAGDFDWVLAAVRVPKHSEPWLPAADAHEVGTDLPSVIDPRLGQRHQALRMRPGGFEWEPFTGEVREVYQALVGAPFARVAASLSAEGAPVAGDHAENHAPTILRVAALRARRAAVTEELLLQETARERLLSSCGLSETIADARVCSVQLVGVDSDRFFDSVTVRVYAAGYFAVVRAPHGAIGESQPSHADVVSGSPHRERVYSEYWTFVRPVSPAADATGSGFRLAHRRADEAQRAPT